VWVQGEKGGKQQKGGGKVQKCLIRGCPAMRYVVNAPAAVRCRSCNGVIPK
jgi:hypothetical protein